MERTVGPQIIRTLNEMLEEERAAVEAVIGLASMATDPSERETLQRVGGDEVWACSGLRGRIEALGGTPSMHISDFANYVLSLEYFPERLRTFGRHQRLIMERIGTLLAQRGLDDETRQFLDEMRAQHEADIAWCETRASVFETSRYGGEAPPPRPTLPLPPMARHQPSPAASLPPPPAPAPTNVTRTPPAMPPVEETPAPTPKPAATPKPKPTPTPPAEPPTPAPVSEADDAAPAPAPERPRRGRKRVTPEPDTAKNNGADAPA